jgi:hypothetical protein
MGDSTEPLNIPNQIGRSKADGRRSIGLRDIRSVVLSAEGRL